MKKQILIMIVVLMSVFSYAQIPLLGNIETGDPRDAYYLVDDLAVKGGFTVVKTLALRNDFDATLNPTGITEARRDTGMLAYVVDEGKFYQLIGGITNDKWQEIELGNFELFLRDYVFDTIKLRHDGEVTDIWRLELRNDSLFFNDEIMLPGQGSGGALPLINADRQLNFLDDGDNVANILGRNNVRLDSLVEAVFYAALPPTASLSSTADDYLEYGSANNTQLSWTATKATNPLASILLNGEEKEDGSGNSQSGSQTVGVTPNVTNTFTLEVEDSKGMSVSRSVTHRFRHRVYVGLEDDGPQPDDPWYDAITDNDIIAYPYSPLKSDYPGGGTTISLSNPNGARIVVVAPSSWGQPKAWFEGTGENTALPLTFVRAWSFENQYGYDDVEFSMWVSNNKQNTNPLNIHIDGN